MAEATGIGARRGSLSPSSSRARAIALRVGFRRLCDLRKLGRARARNRVAKLAKLCSVWLIVGLTLVLVVFPLVVIWLVARAFLLIARVLGAWARAGRA